MFVVNCGLIMQLIEVNTTALAQRFIDVNVQLLKNVPNYIRPLDKDIQEVFDVKKNKTFKNGTVIRWLLKDDNGKWIGRIAAFTNKKYITKGDDVQVGGIGFFDCINNQEAANLLLNTAKNWLLQNGVQAMDGPINFGERDKWWGLVVEGFNAPLYCMNFNPPYYVTLFENYGFKPFFYQLCISTDPRKDLNAKILERHKQISLDNNFRTVNINKNNLGKFAEDFATIYNKAWAGHGGLKQIKVAQINSMFKTMKPIMDENIIWFVYYNEDPIAFFVNIPDLNYHFKKLDGKFGLLQKLKFLYLQKFNKSKKFVGIVFGIIPEYQGKGVDGYLIEEARRTLASKTNYEDYEMQWIGDFNPKMVNVATTLGDTFISRKLCTYRYLFDREKEFKRHPMLG
jgi:hypothetical protein